ncbi:intercellular adhesion molecule 4 isoform X2 [Ochotona curzoniae]|uniref:intercellular adhesion molecule 4 isoform X2 n=1 Tax=Ochotona curzoniae TaxID=130825 RepID=UPI001B346235|nr:intercellular adhesion molecule 4 isoform X2 [Ochotona curzoniae]
MGSALLLGLGLWLGSFGLGAAGAREQVPFWVRLSPEQVAVLPGHSVWLNCSTSCPLVEKPSLQTQLQRGQTLSGPCWVSYELLDVRARNSTASCSVTRAGETRGATARITTYKPPGGVVLEPPVLVGGVYTLRCHIIHVFPVNSLVVTLRLGGRLISHDSLECFEGQNMANVTVTHQWPARPRDLWQPLTCHWSLHLPGRVVHSSSAPVTLAVIAWSSQSKALACTSIAALGGLLLALGGAYLRRCLARKSQM